MTNSVEEKPKLFAKPAVFIFSILLSTIFGALLFAQNLKEVGKQKEIFKIILFAFIWNLAFINILGKIIHNGFAVYGFTNALGGIILIFPFWNYYLKEIIEYDRKKVWGPLILFIVLLGGLTAFLLLYKRG